MSRPNILVILSDQHNPHVMGCAGDPIVRTPHLDRLAAQGVRFSSAYCGAPVCVPSRMSLLTSQFPSDIEVWTNACLLSPDVSTFAHMLSLAGYETVLCGRMHFVGPDQHRGFERRLVGDVSGALAGVPQGGLFEGKLPAGTTGQSHLTMEVVGAGRCTYTAYDDAVTARAVQFLQERGRSGSDRPFCLMVGYLLPHCPYICPKPLFDEYMRRVELPEVPDGYPDALHPAMRHWWSVRGVDKIAPDRARAARAAYYGMVTYLDERIGEVLAALEESSLAGDTVVAYLSDHGEMAGEHGLWWKESFYEGAVGVPMIWSWPRRFPAGRISTRVCTLLDVGPTCIELAGAELLPHARGASLLSLLMNETPHDEEPPRSVFSEMYPRGPGMRPARMIRKGPWKLNLYHGHDDPQLFNLQEDPGERCDLGRSRTAASIRDELLEEVRRDWRPERIEAVVERRRAQRDIAQRWRRSVRTRESERWRVPEGSNQIIGYP